MFRKVRFMLALVMLALFLGSGAANALPTEGRNTDREPGLLAAVWEWAVSLVDGKVPFLHVTEQAGGTVPTVPQGNGSSSGSDGGGSIDPNG
jgi:hypothetical protein